MRTKLAERLGVEPEETTRERQERIRALYEQRKAMRRLAKLCCVWVSGAAFVLAVIAAYGQMIDAAAVTAGISLMTAGTGILL